MLEQKQIKRLLDIAFLGCQKGHIGLARNVIEGLDQMLENSVELEICRAMSFYTVDQFEKAAEVLSAAGEKFPGDQMIKTYSALVDILMENLFEAKEKLNSVISKNKDKDAVNLAQELFGQYY